jgi:hypothetical protein
MRFCPWAAVVILAAATLLPGAASAGQFAPHRAVYEMELAKARSSQAASAISGRMVFAWEDVCDGWTVDVKARMRVTFGDRGARDIAWSYSSWEADDSQRFRFYLRRQSGAGGTERVRGEARLMPGEGGTARFTEPEERTVELPRDTLFPMAHTERVLDRAAAGDQLIWAHLFDGTGDGDGLFGVNAVVTQSYAAGEALPMAHALLDGQESWRVALAYFPAGASASTPESEQSTRLFDNGVAGHLTIDYGNFVVRGELTELEALERPDCP